jgi:hypothetical protein
MLRSRVALLSAGALVAGLLAGVPATATLLEDVAGIRERRIWDGPAPR